MFDVIFIGFVIVDIFVKFVVLKISCGCIVVDFGIKNEIDYSFVCFGGGVINFVVVFVCFGLKFVCLSLLGQDPFSSFIINDLKTNSVSTNFLIRLDKEATDFSIVLVNSDGARSILVNRGSICLESKQIPWSRLDSSWFYITSLEGNLTLLEQLIGYAQENSIKVALNPGSREIANPKKLIPLLKYVDFLSLNKTEAQTLISQKISAPNFYSKFQSFGPDYIAITNGRRGAHLLTSDHHLFSPVVDQKTVEETGAGDAFGSTFVAALFYHQSPETGLFWAIKNSASVVSHLGAKAGLLTLKQIKK